MKLGVITTSVREGRIGDKIANWAYEMAKKNESFDEVELIDLKELDLPVLNEPNHPGEQNYQHDKTKRWSKTVDSLDAFVFVMPEYDFFAPGSMVNALQHLHNEWSYKPAGFVSYGGISGGLRSVQSVKPLLATTKVVPLPEGVSFPFPWGDLTEDSINSTESHDKTTNSMFAELRRWAEALSTLR